MTTNKSDHFGPTTVLAPEDCESTLPVGEWEPGEFQIDPPKTEEDFSFDSLTEVRLGKPQDPEDLELAEEASCHDYSSKGIPDVKEWVRKAGMLYQGPEELFLKEILSVHPHFADMDLYERGVFNRFTQSDIYFRALDKLKKRNWNKKRIARFMFKELERYREEASRFEENEHPL